MAAHESHNERISVSDVNFIVVDVETTGTNATDGRMTEIACVLPGSVCINVERDPRDMATSIFLSYFNPTSYEWTAHFSAIRQIAEITMRESKGKLPVYVGAWAITERETLSETVTDVLVEHGDQVVIHAAARNMHAKFSDRGFGRLVERSPRAAAPGAACDVESYVYLPLLEEMGNVMTSTKYPFAPEILEHSRRIARHFGLYDDALFQTGITQLQWEEATERWIVRFTNSTSFEVIGENVGVIATGNTSISSTIPALSVPIRNSPLKSANFPMTSCRPRKRNSWPQEMP